MSVQINLPATFAEWGVNGQAIAGVDTGFAANVVPLNPTVLVIQIGINDASGGTPQASFLASYRSVYAKAIAIGVKKFLLVNALVDGEVWQAGPVWAGNSFDAAIAARNADIVTIRNEIVALGCQCEVVDVRAALLPLNVIRNPGAASGGRVTLDQVHPTPEVELLMGRAAIAQCLLVTGGPGDVVVDIGDSISNPVGPNLAWQREPTGFFDMLRAAATAHARTNVS